MADTSRKSQVVTDLDASPVVKTNNLEIGGVVREAIAKMALTAAEVEGDAASVFRFVRVPANARISKVEYVNDDLDDGAALEGDIGLYEVNGGSAKDANFFADAVSLQAANITYQDATHEAGGAYGVEDAPLALWEALGDSDTPENRA